MKKNNILLCLAIILLASCTSNQNKFEATHFPFKKDKGGLWGFVDANGKVVIEDEFRNQPSLVIDGMFFVKTSDKSDLLSAFSINNPTNPVAEGLIDIAFFSDGLAPCVKEGEGIKYIDKQGNVKFELPLEYIYAKQFENGYSMIARKEKGELFWDAINTKGELLKLSGYSLLVPLRNGCFLANKENSQHYCIINNKGNLKTSLDDINIYFLENHGNDPYPADLMGILFNINKTFSSDYKYYVFKDTNVKQSYYVEGVKNIDGTVISKANQDAGLYFLNNDKVAFKNQDDYYGIENIKGDVMIRPKYTSIESFGKSDYIVSKATDNGLQYGLINQKEDHVLGFDYDDLIALSDNTLLATILDFNVINGIYKYQIITTKGDVLGEYTDVIAVDKEFGYKCVQSDYFDVKNVIVDNSSIQCVANPKSTIGNSQIREENHAVGKSYNYYNLVGNVAGSDVHMAMIVDDSDVWGRYYYDSQRKKGSTAYMSFFGRYHEGGFDLTEYYLDKNKPTGTFNGDWEDDVFSGTFTRTKDGKTFGFSLTKALGNGDVFFKEEDLYNEKPLFE